ncbi:MAG: hypothetical protein AAGJ31_07070, partial [Verrucomicrobiota bacterium]
ESDRDVAREEARVLQEKLEAFQTIRVPELQWGKAIDDLKFGPNRSNAILVLARHLRDHLEHPNAQDWLEELKGFATGGPLLSQE